MFNKTINFNMPVTQFELKDKSLLSNNVTVHVKNQCIVMTHSFFILVFLMRA